MTAQENLIAIRVLAAITAYRQPEPGDVEILRSLYPQFPEAETGELACKAILEFLAMKKPIAKEQHAMQAERKAG